MTTTNENGRLGNQIIRNLAVSLIAEKFDLNVNYSNREWISNIGIELFSGTNVYPKTQRIGDDDYFTVYNSDSLDYNLDPNHNFFQTKEITNYLHDYLHSERIKSAIMDKNTFKGRYQNNNDLYVHVRLTDAARFNPGIAYYLHGIQNVQFDNLYISTDDRNHDIIRELLSAYPNANVMDYDEIATIQFASTCKHILLSHGSFSSVIGYLAFFSDVYYPEYQIGKIWYGDMFSIAHWHKLTIPA